MISRRRICKLFLVSSIAFLLLVSVFAGWYIQPFIRSARLYDDLRETYTFPVLSEKTESASTAMDGMPDSEGGDDSLEPYRRQIDWNRLSSINADLIGWIYVPGTPIDYPVVQARQSDPNKYLRTTFEGAVSYPNNQGTIFLDVDNSDHGFDSKAPVLYGHYQLDNSMFSAFSSNGDIESLSAHKRVIIFTPSKMFHVELFAGNYVDATRERIKTSFTSTDELDLWIRSKLAESEAVLYEPDHIEQLFTFVTCSYSIWHDQRTLTYGRVVNVSPL